MSDRGWKQFERRLSKDMGTTRIPVTGERHGADAESTMFVFQFKLRKCIPAFLFEWLAGIAHTGARHGKVGVLVLKTPRMRDEDSVVMVRWKDWVALHGEMQMPAATRFADRKVYDQALS